jgi:formylglycine-generating enzyme required for sulfatase activity
MSIVLYAIGIIVNGIVGVLPDLAVNIAANIVNDNAKKIYDKLTIQKGRHLHVLHPVIESALVNSFYNAIILSLSKTQDYYKRTSRDTYKKEIIQISARIKDLKKLLKGQSSSGYSVLFDTFCEVMVIGTTENNNRLITIAKNNLIGLADKTKTDLEIDFIGIFLVFFKEKYASNEILRSLFTFDILQANLSLVTDANRKIDTLIYSHMNIETELQNINSTVSNLPSNKDYVEIRDMLISIQKILTTLATSEKYDLSSGLLLERSYLDVIYNKYKYSELPSFDRRPIRTHLKDIYFPLELINRIAITIDNNGQETKLAMSKIEEYNSSNSSRKPFLIERMSIFDVVSHYSKAFIIGESGTGKTFTAQHILCCLSGHQSSDSNYWNEERCKLGLNDPEQIPIFISLLAYFRYGDYGNGTKNVLKYLQDEFSLQDNLLDYLKSKLLNGKVTVILKDCAFSEVPASCVLNDISDFINNYSRCQYFIFRSDGNDSFYDQYSVFHDMPKFSLDKLRFKKMQEMADKYCSVLSTVYDTSTFSFERFVETIKEIGLKELSEKPYWFGLLLSINFAFNELPDNTLSIHTKIVDNMLNRFLSLFEGFSELDRQNLFFAFELLAINLFISENATLPKTLIQEVFEKYFTLDKTTTIIQKLKTNDCELIEYNQNNMFGYVHKSLISTLVSRYFKRNIDSISTLVDYSINNPIVWVESLALLFNEKNYDLLAFVLFILKNAEDKDYKIRVKISLEILSKINVQDFTTRVERKNLVQSILDSGKRLIESKTLPIQERIIVARNLSLISIANNFLIDFDLYFSKVPAGIVVLGNDKLTSGEPYDYEVTYDFYAGKMPVTNFEYQQFLLEKNDYPLPLDESNIWDVLTRHVDKRYLNHPVVGVGFYDAIQYCRWFQSKVSLPQGYRVWLPSDPEWMKMYRGGKILNGTTNHLSDRIYPWGNDWIEGYANVPKLDPPICSTTPVGIFIEGISEYGCYDTCGNVLEWTTTSWGGFNPDTPEYPHPYNPNDGRENLKLRGLRITRGGSFLFSEGDAKCSCRLDPDSKFPDTGFRIFIVPTSHQT